MAHGLLVPARGYPQERKRWERTTRAGKAWLPFALLDQLAAELRTASPAGDARPAEQLARLEASVRDYVAWAAQRSDTVRAVQ